MAVLIEWGLAAGRRLSIPGAIIAGLLFFVFAPIGTVSVKVDLPPLPPGARTISAGDIQTFALSTSWITEAVVCTIILGVAGWIALRIIRRHRTVRR